MTVYMFDMDGTLTPEREPMEPHFKASFQEWLKTHTAYIVTGSDFTRVSRQIPAELRSLFSGIYTCMGNELWQNDVCVKSAEFQSDPALIDDLTFWRNQTKYPAPLFDHFIEQRPGMINFNILGHGYPKEERIKFQKWLEESGELTVIQKQLQDKHPHYDFCIGGTISLDIIPKGHGKDQVVRQIKNTHPTDKIVFFGDNTYSGGNDYTIAKALGETGDEVVQVSSPNDVLAHLCCK